MKWTLKDKVIIPGILPKESTLLIKTLCRDIKKKIELTADEVKNSGLESSDTGLTWKENIDVKLDFTKNELNLLKTSANQINKDEKVTDDNFELIEKLCD